MRRWWNLLMIAFPHAWPTSDCALVVVGAPNCSLTVEQIHDSMIRSQAHRKVG
jgi:hypothetical protein